MNTNQTSDVTILNVVKTMQKFIAQSERRNTASEFEFLYNLVSPAYIRIKFEITTDDSATGSSTTWCSDAAGDEQPQQHINKRHQNQHGSELPAPNFSFMNCPGTVVKRVLLTQTRERSNYKYPLSYEANGIVLDASTWKVLSLPSHALNDRMPHAECISKLNTFSVYRIIDGTAITLYYNGSTAEPIDVTKWTMSSTNGYDVSNYKWIGPKTYTEAFSDVAAMYPNFSFAKLDPNCSYTIVFRHPDFHQFAAGSTMYASVISCFNVTTCKQVYKFDIGIEGQKPVDMKTVMQLDDAAEPTQKEQFTYLQQSNSNALNNYLAAVVTANATPDQVLARAKTADPASIHYGYILRSGTANVILESTLLKKIRQFMYNLPRGDKLKELLAAGVIIDNTTRTRYCTLRAFLSPADRKLFFDLFPQFHADTVQYATMLSQLSLRILNCFKNKKARSRLSTSTVDSTTSTNSVMLDRIAVHMFDYISSKEKLNVYGSDSQSIINDYIVDSRYTDLYLQLTT